LKFIIEQILFISLKYTYKGKIKIRYISDTKELYIEDTGIGIAEDDRLRSLDAATQVSLGNTMSDKLQAFIDEKRF